MGRRYIGIDVGRKLTKEERGGARMAIEAIRQRLRQRVNGDTCNREGARRTVATNLDYQKHVATLARACGVAVMHMGDCIIAQFPNTFEGKHTIKFEHDAWRDVLTYLVAYAKREGVTVPQSTELLLEED